MLKKKADKCNLKFGTERVKLWALKEFRIGTQKRVRISHGKRVIGVRTIEVRFFIIWKYGVRVRISHGKRVIGVRTIEVRLCIIWKYGGIHYIHLLM